MVFLYILSHAPGGLTLSDFKSATGIKIVLAPPWSDFLERIQAPEDHDHPAIGSHCDSCTTQYNILLKTTNTDLNDQLYCVFKSESQFLNQEHLAATSRRHFFI